MRYSFPPDLLLFRYPPFAPKGDTNYFLPEPMPMLYFNGLHPERFKIYLETSYQELSLRPGFKKRIALCTVKLYGKDVNKNGRNSLW
jgi:hypothetical protein